MKIKNKLQIAKIISIVFGIVAGYAVKEETLVNAAVAIIIVSFAFAAMIILALCRNNACQKGRAYKSMVLILMASVAISAAFSTEFIVAIYKWQILKIPLGGDVPLKITIGVTAILMVFVMLNAMQCILPAMTREIENARKKIATKG